MNHGSFTGWLQEKESKHPIIYIVALTLSVSIPTSIVTVLLVTWLLKW